MSAIVLFAVGSPLTVEYEETCRRLGVEIVAGIRNRAGETYGIAAELIRSSEEIHDALRKIPCLCPLFTPANRRTACAEAEALGFTFAPALIDPHGVVASSTVIGEGSYINAGVVIGAEGRIGRQAVINRLAGIGHHARIGDFVSIGPGVAIAGQVEIGDGALIGAGAIILPKLRIGAGAVVSAGAVVTQDVPDGILVRGNPARPASQENSA